MRTRVYVTCTIALRFTWSWFPAALDGRNAACRIKAKRTRVPATDPRASPARRALSPFAHWSDISNKLAFASVRRPIKFLRRETINAISTSPSSLHFIVNTHLVRTLALADVSPIGIYLQIGKANPESLHIHAYVQNEVISRRWKLRTDFGFFVTSVCSRFSPFSRQQHATVRPFASQGFRVVSSQVDALQARLPRLGCTDTARLQHRATRSDCSIMRYRAN